MCGVCVTLIQFVCLAHFISISRFTRTFGGGKTGLEEYGGVLFIYFRSFSENCKQVRGLCVSEVRDNPL